MSVAFTVKGQDQLLRVAEALKEADRRGLARELQKAIKDAAGPTLADIKDSAEHISTQGVEKPGATRRFTAVVAPKGTRKKIAEAVVADIRTRGDDPRVRFRTAKSRLPAVIQNMPRRFDDGHFRHPIMGNFNAWVAQTSHPWWWEPIHKNIRTFRAEIGQAIDRTKEQIERAA